MRLDGKVALITGGASGLGHATAVEVTRAGASVVIADLSSSDGRNVADGIGGVFCATDVTSEDDVRAAVESAAELGGLHVVVNCAGIATAKRVLDKQGNPSDLESFERVVRVNLIGSYNVIRVAAAAMATQDVVDDERGVVVNTSSVAAFDGQIGQAAYSASKGGIASLTLPLARDLATKKIRCVAIAPGTMDTPMLAGLDAAAMEDLAKNIPHPHRLGKATEYAALVRHIIENPYINGTTIRLDGALRMPPR